MFLGTHLRIRFLLLVPERVEYSHSSDYIQEKIGRAPDFLSELGLFFSFVQSNQVILHDGSMLLAANHTLSVLS